MKMKRAWKAMASPLNGVLLLVIPKHGHMIAGHRVSYRWHGVGKAHGAESNQRHLRHEGIEAHKP